MDTSIESPTNEISDAVTTECTWWSLSRHPALAFMTFASLAAMTNVDRWIAHTFFYRDHDWVGAHVWFVNDVVHAAGTWFARGLLAASIAIWIAGYFLKPLACARRAAGFLALSFIFGVGTIGLLKELTHIDCPWSLREFGGSKEYVQLLEAPPTNQPTGRCFPAAHASAGYCLLALYFMARERSRHLSRLGLLIGICAGLLFGIAQQSRGAHFFSHDLWSAFIVWSICSALYVHVFGSRLWVARD
ncbi:MAG TPA: phosphatase PAP2 family protein, partial [Steroidobacteraceae bacterium]|nr:phosphatase PAP2 family protein [Steroidobacteraceae bacterium]